MMSTVIKANEAGPILPRLSTVDLADHLAEASAVVEAAQRRAAQIIADAKRKAEHALTAAQETGYNSGLDRGLAEGAHQGHRDAHQESLSRFAQQHANIVSAMQQALQALERMKEDLMITARKDLLDFAVLLATKLTFKIGRLYPESALENLRRALRLVESKTDLTIRMHPDDVAAAQEFAASLLRQAEASRAATIVADESVSPGGCRVETGCTRVDATLETQVDELVSLLLCGKQSNA